MLSPLYIYGVLFPRVATPERGIVHSSAAALVTPDCGRLCLLVIIFFLLMAARK